ncbi:major facilitator superfamily domain-containing protein [Podospora conica]|nr:major facilitator superfamily domain-containing protein [Schizothecium conicum]
MDEKRPIDRAGDAKPAMARRPDPDFSAPAITTTLHIGTGSDSEPSTPDEEKKNPIPDNRSIDTDSSSAPLSGPGGAIDDNDFPEGGVRAWLVVLGCWLTLFASLGLINILATFQTYVTANQLVQYSESTIACIFSLHTFVSFAAGIYTGPLFDRYGPRYLLLAGTACLALSIIFLSISYAHWHFLLAFSLLSGLASALLTTPSIAAIAHFFHARRGLATGLASTAAPISAILLPLLFHRLFLALGFTVTIRVLAALCFAFTLPANFLVRSRLPPPPITKSIHPSPRILTHRPFALTTLAIFLLQLALFLPLTFLPSSALALGHSHAFAYSLVALLNTGSVAGRVAAGWAGDRIGPFNASAFAAAASAALCLGLWLPLGHARGGMMAFALLFGVASGGGVGLVPAAVGRLCRAQEYGRYYATCSAVVSAAVLVGIPIAGRVVEGGGGRYGGLIVLTGAVYCGAAVAFLAAKVSVVGWRFFVVF